MTTTGRGPAPDGAPDGECDARSRAARRCPCGSGDTYGDCCGRWHAAPARGPGAPTAEALMRSRYCAFVVGDRHYLLRTWHPSTRPASLALPAGRRWLRLVVERTTAGGPFDTRGSVRFRALYRDADGDSPSRGEQVETSAFVREDGRWYYLGGELTG